MGDAIWSGQIVHVQSMRRLVDRVKRGNVSIGGIYYDGLPGWHTLQIKDCGVAFEYSVSESMLSTVRWFLDNLDEFEGVGDG